MPISDAGLNLIKQSEGFRGQVYNDVAGIPTIGYGHRILPAEDFSDGISEEEATALLLHDVDWAEHAVERLVTVALSQGQYDALVDFTYNLGAQQLANSTLLKLLNQGQYDDAGQQLLRWNKAGGKVQPGLTRRREAELQLWQS